MRYLIASVVCLASLTACSGGGGEAPAGRSLADLRNALDRGGSCAELIEIKNAIDPKTADYEAAPAVLRSVGCFSTSSVRSDK